MLLSIWRNYFYETYSDDYCIHLAHYFLIIYSVTNLFFYILPKVTPLLQFSYFFYCFFSCIYLIWVCLA